MSSGRDPSYLFGSAGPRLWTEFAARRKMKLPSLEAMKEPHGRCVPMLNARGEGIGMLSPSDLVREGPIWSDEMAPNL